MTWMSKPKMMLLMLFLKHLQKKLQNTIVDATVIFIRVVEYILRVFLIPYNKSIVRTKIFAL